MTERVNGRPQIIKKPFANQSTFFLSKMVNWKEMLVVAYTWLPLMASDGASGRSDVSSSWGGGGEATLRRGQFPYAYIRSKLAVLPEEQNSSGQVSRRESMNKPNGEAERYRFASSSRSECGIQVWSLNHSIFGFL